MTVDIDSSTRCGGFEKSIRELFGNPAELAKYVASGQPFAEFDSTSPGLVEHVGDLEEWIRVLPQEIQDVINAVILDLVERKARCWFSWTRDHQTKVVFEINQMGFLSMNIHSPACDDYAAMKHAKDHPGFRC